jgi:hypothetical protein
MAAILQDKVLHTWVCVGALMLFSRRAGLQQQEQALGQLMRQLQATYPAFCMWHHGLLAEGAAPDDAAAAAATSSSSAAAAAAAKYETYCLINRALQQPDSMQRLLEQAALEDVVSRIDKGIKDACGGASESIPAGRARHLMMVWAWSIDKRVHKDWATLRPVLLNHQQWVVAEGVLQAEQPSSSSSSSSSSSRGPETRLADLMPVWGYSTQPRTPDGRPYQPDFQAIRVCMQAGGGLGGLTADGVSVWQAAVQLGDPRLLEALLSCPEEIAPACRQQWQEALQLAAEQGQMAALRLLLQTGAGAMSEEVQIVWSDAIERGQEPVALVLMEAGLDVNGPCGEEGDTALLALARARSTWGLDPDQVSGLHVSSANLVLINHQPTTCACKQGNKVCPRQAYC